MLCTSCNTLLGLLLLLLPIGLPVSSTSHHQQSLQTWVRNLPPPHECDGAGSVAAAAEHQHQQQQQVSIPDLMHSLPLHVRP